ncbi:TPA: hypothetical protein ACJG67_002825 [Salmonella enterica subsp. enterica serovar Kottbus]
MPRRSNRREMMREECVLGSIPDGSFIVDCGTFKKCRIAIVIELEIMIRNQIGLFGLEQKGHPLLGLSSFHPKKANSESLCALSSWWQDHVSFGFAYPYL